MCASRANGVVSGFAHPRSILGCYSGGEFGRVTAERTGCQCIAASNLAGVSRRIGGYKGLRPPRSDRTRLD